MSAIYELLLKIASNCNWCNYTIEPGFAPLSWNKFKKKDMERIEKGRI